MQPKEISFTITEYADGTYRIETEHLAFRDRDGLFYDNVDKSNVAMVMNRITYIMNNVYKTGAVFEVA